MRMNEMVTGIRSDVAVKLYGDDLDVLVAKVRDGRDPSKAIDFAPLDRVTTDNIDEYEKK